MIDVIPGILEQDFNKIKAKIKKVAAFVEWVQIDLADGILVDNETFSDPEPFKELKVKPRLELHMMVENPAEQVGVWVGAGFARLVAQIEGIGDPEAFIDAVQMYSVEVGLALDLETPVSMVEPYLDILDVVLLMGVEVGFSGQEFDPGVLDKIRRIREANEIIAIVVDGGINDRTARMVSQAGASGVISTSYIFNSDDVGEAIKRLFES